MLDITRTKDTLDGVFDWQSWIEYVSDTSTIPKMQKVSSHDTSREAWFGSPSYENAMELARTGWTEGAERARAMSGPLFDRVSSLIARQNMVYDVEGIGFDVARLLDGEPEHWFRWEEEIISGPGNRIVKIAFNQTISGGLSAEIFEAKGSVISSLVELLEYAGTRCEVWCVMQSARNEHRVSYKILVKAADQPLDLPRLMFALAHPSSFRRLGFSFIERCNRDMWRETYAGSYGSCKDFDSEQQKEWDIYVPVSVYGDKEWTNPEVAKQYLIGLLRAQGVVLTEESETVEN